MGTDTGDCDGLEKTTGQPGNYLEMDIEKTLELFAAITGREIAYGDGMSLFRFAKAVAAAEREACAKVCNDLCDCGPDNGCCPTYWNEALERAEEAIKARSNAVIER